MPTDIGRDEVQRLQAEGAVLLEVLPKEEFEREHIPGAVNLPLGQVKPEIVGPKLERKRPIVVYCQDVE